MNDAHLEAKPRPPLRAGAVKPGNGYAFATYHLDLAVVERSIGPVSWANLFEPSFWRDHAKTLHEGDVIRVRASDGSFDCEITVAHKFEGGILMESYPNPRPGSAEHLAIQKLAEDAKIAHQAALDAELGTPRPSGETR